MEINNMSASEMAEQFAASQAQAQTSQNEPNPAAPEPAKLNPLAFSNLSIDEMRAKAAGETPKLLDSTPNPEVKLEIGNEDFINQIDEHFFKKGVLNPFNNEDGTEGYAVPKTWNDFTEVIKANIDFKVNEVKSLEKQTLLSEITKESSPALRFIIDNASSFRTPQDMLPLIQSVQRQDFFSELNTDTPESQEYIVRNAMFLQGLDEASITEEIKDLKERERLEIRATQLKPILDKVSAEQTQAIIQEQEQKNEQDQLFWNQHFAKMNEDLINAADLDGMQISNQHKSLIANMLVPNQELGGLPLYSVIDQHVGQGNIKLLAKVAMLLNNEQEFDLLYGSKKAASVANSLQRTLRSSLVSNSTNQQEQQNQNVTKTTNKYGNYSTTT